MTDYERIEQAIGYLKRHHLRQPDLEEVAQAVHLSPFHFQKLFKEWAGVSPKKFLQYISVTHARQLLRRDQSLFQTSLELGLSGPGRLHDLFLHIEGMTPGTYKKGGAGLTIRYRFAVTVFGEALVATTDLGLCHLAFVQDRDEDLQALFASFPEASFLPASDAVQEQALRFLTGTEPDLPRIKLHLKGTPFQLKVWQALLQIPTGSLATYAEIAGKIQLPAASRAVGSAVGANPVAFLIPCHRVIRATGIIGEYRWGSLRKTAMLGWESSRLFGDLD
jgi:AraC family transcriptional regulator of adaptative response/methylated-DNA-[protein]-cysteine methyltransferase